MIGLLALLSTADAQEPDWTLCAVCSKDAEESFENEAIWACAAIEHHASRLAGAYRSYIDADPPDRSTVFAGVKWESKPERMMQRLDGAEWRDPDEFSGPEVLGSLPSGFPVEVTYWKPEHKPKKGIMSVRLPLLPPDDPRCAAAACTPCEAGIQRVADRRAEAEAARAKAEAKALAEDLARPFDERYERGRKGQTTPEQWIRLLSKAGWTVEGRRWIPPDSDWHVLMSPETVPEGLSMRIDGDALPLGLEQGSRAALREKYGEPWVEPPEGELLLVAQHGRQSVRLVFSPDGGRVEEVIWLYDEAPSSAVQPTWGGWCPVDYKCRTSDGYTLEGRIVDGVLVSGRVRDVAFREVATITPPPKTPEELAAEAKAAAEAEIARQRWLITQPAQYANDMLDRLASARASEANRRAFVLKAQGPLRLAGWEAEAFVAKCPDQAAAIRSAKAILDRAQDACAGDMVAAQAAMERAGPAFISAWNGLQPALADCLGLDAPDAVESVVLTERPGEEVVLHPVLGVRARPPAGWTCDAAQHTCRGAAGHLYMRRHNLGGGDLAGLVDRLWAEEDGGCIPPADAPGGAVLFCEQEGGGRVLHRLHETSGVVVDLRLATSRWSSARGDEWRALLAATEVRGQPATLPALPSGDFRRPPGPDLSGLDLSQAAGPTARTEVVAKVWYVDPNRGPVCSDLAVTLPAGWDEWATRHEATWAVLQKKGVQLISVDVLRDGAVDVEGRVRGGCEDFGTVRK